MTMLATPEATIRRWLSAGTLFGGYVIPTQIGAGGPASARSDFEGELRRGLAEAEAAR